MEPIFVSDLKVASTDYEKAFVETAAYAVRIMEDREGRATYHCILVGLPMTLEHISLCLYVEVPEKVMCITIQKISRDDTQGLRNLFCILYIVVHYLKDNPVRKNKITHTYEMPIEAAVSTTVVNSSRSKLAVKCLISEKLVLLSFLNHKIWSFIVNMGKASFLISALKT